jgi:hypothetical protein
VEQAVAGQHDRRPAGHVQGRRRRDQPGRPRCGSRPSGRSPFFNRIRHLDTTTFWVGDNSEANAPLNQPATRFLHELLSDVQDGGYVASDAERQHVRQLLAHRDGVPVIHGPCLITGANADGEPGPLSENFQDWFTALLKKAAQLRGEIGLAIANALGIPADMINRIVIVGLD